MLQSTIILNLLEQMAGEGDPEKRADLARTAERQYYLDMEHQANFVQTRIGSLELDIREQVATSLGNTNEMISQSVAEGRELRGLLEGYFVANTAAMEGLRSETQAGFRGTSEQINALGERLSDVEGRVGATESRLDASERHRALLQAGQADIIERLGRIEAQLSDGPVLPPAERAAMTTWLLDFIRRSMAREAGDGA